jgi:hypothetical protein
MEDLNTKQRNFMNDLIKSELLFAADIKAVPVENVSDQLKNGQVLLTFIRIEKLSSQAMKHAADARAAILKMHLKK